MEFVPSKRPTVSYPISVSIYGEDGQLIEIAFVAQYRRATRKELIDLNDAAVNQGLKNLGSPVDDVRADGSTVPAWPYPDDESFIKDRMVGWTGVTNAAKEALAFSEQALSEVLADYPELIAPLFQGFFSAHQGARQKN